MEKEKKRLFILFSLIILIFSCVIAEELPIFGQEKKEFNVDPGLTPDNVFYFLDEISERITIGNDPEKALEYKEEKIAEAKAMIKKGKQKETKQVLDKASEYNYILEKEVNPEIQEKVKESSLKIQEVLNEMRKEAKDNNFLEIEEKFYEGIKQEERIKNSAEISLKLKEICAYLSETDLLQYEKNCIINNSPKWLNEFNKPIIEFQKEQLKLFLNEMTSCFKDNKYCECKNIEIKSFMDFCIIQKENMFNCFSGKKENCKRVESGRDEFNLIPDYLLEEFYKRESRYELSKFESFAPEECLKQEIRKPKECNKLLFKSNVPQECLEKGLTGESKKDYQKCRKLLKKDYSEEYFTIKFNKECKSIEEPFERLKCYDEFLEKTQINS